MRAHLLCAVLSVACAVEPVKPTEQETSNPARCQERPLAAKFDGAPLGEIVKEISAATCKTFVLTEALKQTKLTLLAPDELAAAPLIDALRKAVSVNGMELAEKDGVLSITQTPRPASAPVQQDEPASLPRVERTGELSVTIEREAVNGYLSNPEEAMKQVRVVPSIKDGEINGFKLFAIRSSSTVYQLGFKNGDIVQAVNGKKLDSLETTMAFVPQLETQSDWKIDLLRSGEPVSLLIQVK